MTIEEATKICRSYIYSLDPTHKEAWDGCEGTLFYGVLGTKSTYRCTNCGTKYSRGKVPEKCRAGTVPPASWELAGYLLEWLESQTLTLRDIKLVELESKIGIRDRIIFAFAAYIEAQRKGD